MRHKSTLILFGLSLTIILLFVSCQSESTLVSSPVATITSKATSHISLTPATNTLPTATAVGTTSEFVLNPTSLPTIALGTATLSPTLATLTIEAATLTPLPTLTAEELELAIGELLANPMDCDVPCWWGFIPGLTNITEVKHAISPYGFDISEYYDEEGNLYTRLGIGYVAERNDFKVRIVFRFSDSILTGVTAYSPSVLEILNKYGQPDEIWLETMSFEREGDLPVRLNLVYLQEGMAVGYVVDGDIQDDIVIGCFADKEKGHLSLITPNNVTSYRDFSPIFETDRRYLSLVEATGLTMEEFMQQFSDSTQPQCIKTPAELWD